MNTPEVIYLVPGEDIEGYPGMSWCESSAPSDHCDPEEAVRYVRADTLPQPVLPPRPTTGAGMPRYGLSWNGPASPLSTPLDDGYWTPWHLASAENERLQARIAELERREDAMCDLHYANGAKQGFSWGQTSDEKALHQCVSARISAGVSDLAELRNDADKAGGGDE